MAAAGFIALFEGMAPRHMERWHPQAVLHSVALLHGSHILQRRRQGSRLVVKPRGVMPNPDMQSGTVARMLLRHKGQLIIFAARLQNHSKQSMCFPSPACSTASSVTVRSTIRRLREQVEA